MCKILINVILKNLFVEVSFSATSQGTMATPPGVHSIKDGIAANYKKLKLIRDHSLGFTWEFFGKSLEAFLPFLRKVDNMCNHPAVD